MRERGFRALPLKRGARMSNVKRKRKPVRNTRYQLRTINRPYVALDVRGPNLETYVGRLNKLHRPPKTEPLEWIKNQHRLSEEELRKKFDANIILNIDTEKSRPIHRAVNTNLPIMRRVLLNNEKSPLRRKVLRALFDSFYVYEHPDFGMTTVQSDVGAMNKTMWRRYDRLLRATNRILEKKKKPLLW